MWCTLLLSWALAGETSPRAELARGIRLYYDGGRSAATVIFEQLHAERPFDDDVAWWVARSRIDLGRPEEALQTLAGRQGHNLPTWRFEVLEGFGLVLVGQYDKALAMLEKAWPQVQGTAERPGIAAALGMLRAQAGQDEAAAEALRQAGPQPLMALDPVLVGVLEEAVVIEVRGASQGRLDVTRGDGDWRLDLATGLARRGPQEDPNSPSVWARDPSPRGRPDLCPGSSSGWVWTSPAEGLSSGLAGVYRFRSGEVTRLAITPPGAVDISPACLGDRVWFVRRLGEHAEVLRVEGGSVKPLSTGDAGVATVDVRENPRGQPELVLGLVVEGSPGVYWIPGGESTPQLLLVAQQPLLAPRWVD